MKYFALFSIATLALVLSACGDQVGSELSLGEPVTIDGLRLTVDGYELLEQTSGSTPKPGGQFLLLHVTADNVGQGPIEEDGVDWFIEYGGGEVSGSFSTDRGHPMFDPLLSLFPGSGSEGWEQFEVPLDLDLSEVTVVLKLGAVPPQKKIARWRLVDSEQADGG